VKRAWAASGAATVVLFACGLLFGDLLGSSNYPPLNASAGRLRAYFLGNGSEVRALSFFHVLAALALLCFAAYLHQLLRSAAEPRAQRLDALALAGGVAAAMSLLASALVYRTLAEPSVARDPALAHALVVISYLTGGPAIAVALALPIGIVSAATRGTLLLPGWTVVLGLAATVVSLLSAVSLLGPMNNSSLTYAVLLIAAVLAFAWTFSVSVVLALA
jgi:hypothetical protein